MTTDLSSIVRYMFWNQLILWTAVRVLKQYVSILTILNRKYPGIYIFESTLTL